MTKKRHLFSAMTVLVISVTVLSSSISLLNQAESPRRIFHGYSLSVDVKSIDISSCSIGISVDAYLQSNTETQGEWSATMFSPYSDFWPQNFSWCYCANGHINAYGNFTFPIEAHKSLYPFDFYRAYLYIYFPGNVSSEFDISRIEVPPDASDFLCARNLKTHIDYYSYGTYIVVEFQISRPVLYQALVMMPSWFIFITIFVLSSLNPSKAEEFKIKMSIYAALLIFTISFSITGAPTVSITSELLKASLLSILAMFIMTDILIFKKIPTVQFPQRLSRYKEYISFDNFPFILAMVLLLTLSLQCALNYLTGNISALGPVYLFSASVPLIAMYVWQYASRRKLWFISATMCLLVQFVILFVVSSRFF